MLGTTALRAILMISCSTFRETPSFWQGPLTCGSSFVPRNYEQRRGNRPERQGLPWSVEPWAQAVEQTHPWWGWGPRQDAEPPGAQHHLLPNLCSSSCFLAEVGSPEWGTVLWHEGLWLVLSLHAACPHPPHSFSSAAESHEFVVQPAVLKCTTLLCETLVFSFDHNLILVRSADKHFIQ